jgi:hypothetical protein
MPPSWERAPSDRQTSDQTGKGGQDLDALKEGGATARYFNAQPNPGQWDTSTEADRDKESPANCSLMRSTQYFDHQTGRFSGLVQGLDFSQVECSMQGGEENIPSPKAPTSSPSAPLPSKSP